MIDLGTLKIGVTVDKDSANKALGEVNTNAEKSNKIFSNLAKVAIGAFSVKAIIGFGKKVVEASADLQAMNAQFEQVFKGEENGQAVERITAQVGDLGINADRLTDSWNKFGGQVKGAGMDSEMALEAVDKATRLAADSAAFYDKSLEDSTGALASFMKGNFSAGDAIGVFTNAKQMDVKANNMYGKSWADLTESERQWLLLDTVEKTYEMNGAMGQASREANSYENVMGNLRATFKSLWAVIGEPVLEIFLGVVQMVTKWITDNMPMIETTVKNIFIGIKEVWNTVLKPVLSVLLDLFKNIFNFVKDNYPAIKTIIEGVFAGIKFVWETVLKPVLDLLISIFKVIFDIVKDNFPAMQRTVETVFSGIGVAVKAVTKIFEGIVGAIKTAWDWLTKWNKTEAKDKTPSYGGSGRSINGSHANGLPYVPFNGYVAELHKGEEVLRADDPRNQNNGGNSEIVKAIRSLEDTLIKKNMSIGKDAIGKTALDYVRERTKITGELAY